MTANARTSKRPYHHGDLRASLLVAGISMLETHPEHELGLRQLARDVGVSATAVYRHFPDKTALLRAIAAEGFAMLGRRQDAAIDPSANQRARFAATGTAYVRFALQHPALFRLMFSAAPPHDLFRIECCETAGPLGNLRQHAAGLAQAGATEADQKIIAIRAWSLVHGLAVLALDRMIIIDDAMIDSIIANTMESAG